MTRTISALFMVSLACLAANPAQAFCIENKTSYSLRVHLESFSSFKRFRQLFKPGDLACCNWIRKECNPTGNRDGVLAFSIRAKTLKSTVPYCADGWSKQIYATASGRIVVTERPGSIGGLHCDSRDLFQMPVSVRTHFKERRRGLPPPIVVPPRP